MIKDWDDKEICQEIRKITRATNDKYMDGFNTWGCKKDLYQLLWFVQDELDKCSTYVDEKEFVKVRDQKQMLKALGKK